MHRLDMFTSGVVCLAKHVEAAKALHAQFRQNTQQGEDWIHSGTKHVESNALLAYLLWHSPLFF